MAPLTPEAVLETVHLVAPMGIIAVQGYAENVSKPWTSKSGRPLIFGDLVLGGGVLSFQVPAEAAPEAGDRIVIEGHLRAQRIIQNNNDGRRGNWRVTLTGTVVDTWEPREPPPAPLPIPDRDESLPLDLFIEEHGIDRLLILTTEIGQTDITAELVKARIDVRPQFLKANFGDPDAFLRTLTGIQPCPSIKGLAIARGGGIGLDVIASSREVVAALVGTGLPFYAALGHAVNIELLDRYADQVFHSPTALASAMQRSIQAIGRRTWQAREVSRLAALTSDQEKQLAARAAHVGELELAGKQANTAWQARTGTLHIIVIVLGLVAVALLWLLVRHL